MASQASRTHADPGRFNLSTGPRRAIALLIVTPEARGTCPCRLPVTSLRGVARLAGPLPPAAQPGRPAGPGRAVTVAAVRTVRPRPDRSLIRAGRTCEPPAGSGMVRTQSAVHGPRGPVTTATPPAIGAARRKTGSAFGP